MARRPVVDLFCEDAGHEAFVRALLLELARKQEVPRPEVRTRSARGGHGRAITELQLWQRSLRAGESGSDLLVVAIDANGEGWAEQRRNVLGVVDNSLFAGVVVVCPDPHIEAWIAADEGAFRRAFGRDSVAPPARPGRDAYKSWLRRALEEAEVPVLTDPMSISAEFVGHIDMFAAGRASRSFKAATDDLSAFLKRFRDAG